MTIFSDPTPMLCLQERNTTLFGQSATADPSLITAVAACQGTTETTPLEDKARTASRYFAALAVAAAMPDAVSVQKGRFKISAFNTQDGFALVKGTTGSDGSEPFAVAVDLASVGKTTAEITKPEDVCIAWLSYLVNKLARSSAKLFELAPAYLPHELKQSVWSVYSVLKAVADPIAPPDGTTQEIAETQHPQSLKARYTEYYKDYSRIAAYMGKDAFNKIATNFFGAIGIIIHPETQDRTHQWNSAMFNKKQPEAFAQTVIKSGLRTAVWAVWNNLMTQITKTPPTGFQKLQEDSSKTLLDQIKANPAFGLI